MNYKIYKNKCIDSVLNDLEKNYLNQLSATPFPNSLSAELQTIPELKGP